MRAPGARSGRTAAGPCRDPGGPRRGPSRPPTAQSSTIDFLMDLPEPLRVGGYHIKHGAKAIGKDVAHSRRRQASEPRGRGGARRAQRDGNEDRKAADKAPAPRGDRRTGQRSIDLEAPRRVRGAARGKALQLEGTAPRRRLRPGRSGSSGRRRAACHSVRRAARTSMADTCAYGSCAAWGPSRQYISTSLTTAGGHRGVADQHPSSERSPDPSPA